MTEAPPSDADDKRPAIERVIAKQIAFYRRNVEWLAAHHADFAVKAKLDLEGDGRASAVWKLSGQSISHALLLTDELERGYTTQTWPTMRAIHEVNRLLVAVTDPAEERIVRRWSAGQEVKQAEAREAEQRGADRVAAQMREAGIEPEFDDVKQFSQKIYKLMSQAAHHGRTIVDEAIDAERRVMTYGPTADPRRRLDYVTFAGALVHEVLLLGGDALSALWGPGFYADHLQPVLARFEHVMSALDLFSTLERFGLR